MTDTEPADAATNADGSAPAWRAAIGRAETRVDTIRAWPAAALHAALSRAGPPPAEGDPLPLFWRWLYFLDAEPPERLGRDGHPAQGVGLTPTLPVPRRMWAGGRLTRHAPLPIGARAQRRSEVADIVEKTGRSGRLFFVTLRHETRVDGVLVETEEQDLVYRDDPTPETPPASPPPSAPIEARIRRAWRADPTVLFRYSALTFNGHRIHYDLTYATEVEGYAGLVVHGPLLATLMLDAAAEARADAAPQRFTFRAVSPVTHDEDVDVCAVDADGNALDLWVARQGRVAMRGRVDYADD